MPSFLKSLPIWLLVIIPPFFTSSFQTIRNTLKSKLLFPQPASLPLLLFQLYVSIPHILKSIPSPSFPSQPSLTFISTAFSQSLSPPEILPHPIWLMKFCVFFKMPLKYNFPEVLPGSLNWCDSCLFCMSKIM